MSKRVALRKKKEAETQGKEEEEEENSPSPSEVPMAATPSTAALSLLLPEGCHKKGDDAAQCMMDGAVGLAEDGEAVDAWLEAHPQCTAGPFGMTELDDPGKVSLRCSSNAAANELLAAVHAWQFPASCAAVNLEVRRIECSRFYGSYRFMLLGTLHEAMDKDAVAVPLMNEWDFVDEEFCSKRDHACYFLKVRLRLLQQ